jgi:hypothetical protein
MYLNGCASWSPGGIVIFDLADPENPVFKSVYTRIYVHDCFVRNDTIFAAGIYGVGADIVKATNKTSPQYLYTVTYPGAGTHNTTTTGDGKYLFTTDEIGSTAKTLKVWNLSSPPSFPKVAEYVGNATAIVHNAFVRDSLVIMSYYTAGMRVINISDPENPIEVGGYDTYPANDDAAYDGAWSVYPFFPSGKIIIGDMATGMYVVEVNLNGPFAPDPFTAYSDYSTPTSITLTWDDPTQLVSGAPLSNFDLHIYRNNIFIASVDSGIETYVDGGRTLHQQYTYTIRAVTPTESSSVATTQAYAGGHPQPKPPTSYAALDAIGGTQLQWINPSRQVDNTPLNDLAYVLFYRDGILIDSMSQTSADTGQFRTYLDPALGYHSYYIRVRDNESPRNYSTITSSQSTFGGAYSVYFESFDSTFSAFQRTGSWDTTSTLYVSGPNSITDSPGWTYDPGTTSTLVFPTVIVGSNYMFQFKHIAIVAFGDFAFVEISKNHRTTYSALKVYNQTLHSQWQDNSADPGDWVTETLDLSAYDGDTVNVRFRLFTNSSNNLDGWYLDDIVIGPANGAMASSYDVDANWNMVSLPLVVSDASVSALYPSAISNAFAYNTGYIQEDTLVVGQGYWLKFGAGASIPITGSMVRRDTFDVNAGWNILGSLSATVESSAVKSIPNGIIVSPFYKYNGGYSNASQIEPGKGYWVKTSSAGKIILNSFVNKTSPATEQHSILDELNTLTITDAAGNEQVLYFGKGNISNDALARYELPPVPPAGAFDARFTSQQSVAVSSGLNEEQHTLELQGVRYPLRLRWNIRSAPNAESLLLNGRTISMGTSGEIAVVEPVSSIAVIISSARTAAMPQIFGLSQNYPNPFNPRTELAYELADAGFVSLKIFDVLGKEIAILAQEEKEAGYYRATWEAGNAPSGIYYARISVTSKSGQQRFQAIRKLVLTR